jgi:mRNA-degrading endonuclease RelE of RelBE toxin-antitoxin system
MYKLKARDFAGLNVSKLKGSKDVYRFKHGRLRVIYFYNGSSLEILDVGLRNDNTYRNF